MSTPSKKVLYIDMDNTLVDFESGIAKLSEAEQLEAVAVVALFRMINTWTDLLRLPLDEL